jgi:hypothetical protein
VLIVLHNPGVSARSLWSRNTDTARRRFHGFANRCSPRSTAGARRPSAAWL